MTTRALAPIALVVALASCASQPDAEPLDQAVVAELEQIADILSRPHDFPAAGVEAQGNRRSRRRL